MALGVRRLGHRAVLVIFCGPAHPDSLLKLLLTLVSRAAAGPPQFLVRLFFRLGRDQVEDYARRKGWSVEEAQRWLAPVLNYDPVSPVKNVA